MFSAGEGGVSGGIFGSSSKMVEDKQYGPGDIITYKQIKKGEELVPVDPGLYGLPLYELPREDVSYLSLFITETLDNGVKGIDLNRQHKETFGKEIEVIFDGNCSVYNIEKRGVSKKKLEEVIESDRQQPGRLMAFIANP